MIEHAELYKSCLAFLTRVKPAFDAAKHTDPAKDCLRRLHFSSIGLCVKSAYPSVYSSNIITSLAAHVMDDRFSIETKKEIAAKVFCHCLLIQHCNNIGYITAKDVERKISKYIKPYPFFMPDKKRRTSEALYHISSELVLTIDHVDQDTFMIYVRSKELYALMGICWDICRDELPLMIDEFSNYEVKESVTGKYISL